jgi:hypothetical protein
MSLFSVAKCVPNYYIVMLLNSEIIFDYYREFINCTVNIQINDIRQLPIMIPSKEQLNSCYKEFKKAVALKKEYFNNTIEDKKINNELSETEEKLNKFTTNLYYFV